MSAESIYMNYSSTLEKVSQLEDLAVRLRQIADRLEVETYECSMSGWTGSAGDEYMKRGTRAAKKFLRHAQQLERSAGVLRYAATEHYKAEMLALEIIGG